MVRPAMKTQVATLPPAATRAATAVSAAAPTRGLWTLPWFFQVKRRVFLSIWLNGKWYKLWQIYNDYNDLLLVNDGAFQ